MSQQDELKLTIDDKIDNTENIDGKDLDAIYGGHQEKKKINVGEAAGIGAGVGGVSGAIYGCIKGCEVGGKRGAAIGTGAGAVFFGGSTAGIAAASTAIYNKKRKKN